MMSEYEMELVRATLDDRQRQLEADLAADAAIAATGSAPRLIHRLLARFSSEAPRQSSGARSRLRSLLAQ